MLILQHGVVEAQFFRGKCFEWLTSLIHKITDDICFAKPINRAFYPVEWLITTTSGQGSAGNNRGRGGYRGGKQSRVDQGIN
jgi:hypothetical protein